MFSVQNILVLVYENLFSFTILLVFVSLSQHLLSLYFERKRLPPGPTGLPIVGYLPFLGKAPHETLAKLSEKYGKIFTVQLGTNNVVILNDFESIKDAFSKDALSGKPHRGQFTFFGRTKGFQDENGQVWIEERDLSMKIMKELGYGKGSMEEGILEEIGDLIERIEKEGTESVDIHKMLTPSMSNNISQFVFGHKFETDDPKRIQLDKTIDNLSLFSTTGVLATFPRWFSNLALTLAFTKKKLLDQTLTLIDEEVLSHQENFDENKGDYIHGYLAEMRDKKSKSLKASLSLEKLHSNSFSFFFAGSETVRTTTEWLLYTAAHYSVHQKKVQDEIDAVVGDQRIVCWADRLRMPFTQAFISESLRWKTTVPLNLYRRAVEDTYILQHFIPKDTLVLANFWATNYDTKLWNAPEQFNPHRFLSSDGKSLVKTEYLTPFSIGKRTCVGETLAKTELFLYFTAILQKYTISAKKGQKICFDEMSGLTLQPKVISLLQFKKRF